MSEHPRNPYLVTDIVIEIGNQILLIERRNEPYGWALPGGYVEYGETTEDAAMREAKEETGLTVSNLELLGVYSNPERDPRSHNVSVVFVAKSIEGEPKAGDDAKNLRLFDWDELPPLAFDHAKILEDYLIKY